MGRRELLRTDAGTAPAMSESRARVLGALQDAASWLGVNEVAERLGLHPNTVRFHLDALVDAGAVERVTEERDQPGRPRALYSARPDADRVGKRSYRLLAEILAGYVAAETPEPGKAAAQAGRAWGSYLADRPPPFRRVDADAAIGQLTRTLDDIGFAPEPDGSGGTRRILLRHCPFRETAVEHREVVCSVHLGLMQGLLGELRAPVRVERLDPFVEPHLCVARLAEAAV